MNDPVVVPNVNVPEEQPPYQPTFGEQVGIDLMLGALKGVIWCGAEKIGEWLGAQQGNTPIALSSYVFVQFSAAAFVQAAKITHLLFLKCLGERGVYENLERAESYSDALRKHTWTLVSAAQNLERKTDALFSHVLGIRSCKEIEEQGLTDDDLDFLEILRRETQAQAQISITEIASLSLALPLAAHIGFHIATGNYIIWISAGNFFYGTITRISNIYTKRMEEAEAEENRLAELQNANV